MLIPLSVKSCMAVHGQAACFTNSTAVSSLNGCVAALAGGLDARALAEFVGAQVGKLALAPEPKDKIVALMRAVCVGP
eukprot:scaffold233449_cov17-Tisochrysis_lutea.AAC.1